MKKYLPIILLVLGIVVVIAAYFLVIRKPSDKDSMEEEDTSSLIEVSLENRPLVKLMPREDGHWLDMEISKLGLFEADSVDYEVLFEVPQAGLQGTGGNVKLTGEDLVREILIGTESSGKYHYYNNVEKGTFSLRFRNEKGRLVARYNVDFHMQNATDALTSLDGSFAYNLDKESREYFLTMPVIGLPSMPSSEPVNGPYVIFSSSTKPLPGKVTFNSGANIMTLNGSNWENLTDGAASDIGYFMSSN